MVRRLASLLVALTVVFLPRFGICAVADSEIALSEGIDIEVEESPSPPPAEEVPEKISKVPAVLPAPRIATSTVAASSAAATDSGPAKGPAPGGAIAPPADETEPSIEEVEIPPMPDGPAPKGFDEFMKCGIALGKSPVIFHTQILEIEGGSKTYATKGEEIAIQGIYPEGTEFIVYRVQRNSCLAYYIGVIKTLGEMDDSTCRGVVIRSGDAVNIGDLLYAHGSLRRDFDDQRQTAGDEKPIETAVRCISQERQWLHGKGEVVQLHAGRDNGVLYGQMFQLFIPGHSGPKTHGRVIRVDAESCFLKISRIYQPIKVGDVMVSVSNPHAQTSQSSH